MALLDLGWDAEAHHYTYIILDLFISVCGVLCLWEWGIVVRGGCKDNQHACT